ncbi:hypothetical protein AB0C11_39745 [Streptomyces sp. NPDC039016]|uniref:hypothetical protein n=1 Tax=Streptomyces sp. NPDC039016 TaxID=3154330 RepID=UPI003411F664
MKLDELRSALDALAMGPRHQWADVRQIAGTLAPLVWDELKAHGLWDELPEHDQAAVYWALADGHNLAAAHAPNPPRLARLISEVAYFAEECERPSSERRWPEAQPDRAREAVDAVEFEGQYGTLSPRWMVETLRRMETARKPAGWERDQRQAERPSLSVALFAASEAMKRHQAPPEPASYDDRSSENSTGVVRRLNRLPQEWRIEVLRRVAQGGSPAHLASEAATTINVLHSAFGVSLAWNARRRP